MRKHSVLVRTNGGRFVSFFLLAALLCVAHVSPLAAAGPPEEAGPLAGAERHPSGKGGEGKTDPPSTDCDKGGAPCLKHSPVVAGDKSMEGLNCLSGNACNNPGVQRCGIGNAGICQTLNLGAQKCACSCVMP